MRRHFLLTRHIFALVLATISLIAACIVTAPSAEAATEASWNVTCSSVRWATDDPIVFPGQAGASHMHTFYGNTTTNAKTTTQSLLSAGPSSCQREFQNVDKSGYWIPALYRKNAAGDLLDLRPAKPEDYSMTIYYRRAGGATGDKVQAFPQGLRMIAGDPKATTPQKHVSIRCQQTNNGGNQSKSGSDFPNCAENESMLGDIKFPNCWDGKNLDSADHKAHMAYSSGKTQSCPATHPVKMPQLTFEPRWKNINGNGSQYTFASGSAYSLHADFFAAWDPATQAALVQQCPNAGRKCNFKKLSEIKLNPAIVPQADIARQVLGASAEPKLASVAANPHAGHNMLAASATTTTTTKAGALPTTGSAASLGSLAAIGIMGYAWYAYRGSRRNLRNALLRRNGR